MDNTFQIDFQKSKSQLKEFLGRTFLDSSLLLGFVTINQQGFLKAIINDFSKYHGIMENEDSEDSIELEFETIKYMETLWSEFYYPIVKYFQAQHAECFSNVSRDFKESQNQTKKFVVKPVEMRKINENFTKFLKQVNLFYTGLLRHFTTNFENPLLPKLVLKYFEFEHSANALKITQASVQANLLYVTYKCLLSLGDLSRHRNTVEVTYVIPCTSHKEFFKFKELANKEKSTQLRPGYERALQLYKFCILLLPALNEPYNHIGMIYNMIDDKYNSSVWFLRSQFTRLPDYKLGLANLNNILSKKWFVSHLTEIDLDNSKASKYTRAEQLNITLICLIGYFYLPNVYKRGPNVAKKITFSKLESDFFKVLLNSFEELISTQDEFGENFFIQQLTVLFCFHQLIVSSNDPSREEISTKFSRFTFRYVERILEGWSKLSLNKSLQMSNYLITIRFILNWISVTKSVYRVFQSRSVTLERLASMLNSLLLHIDSFNGQSQERISRITDSLKSSSRPTRAYYFHEDVFFRDFLIIAYQFKDFKDDHLFQANDINLLIGDYSVYLHTDIPSFLDNESISRIQHASDQEKNKLVSDAIESYENDLRLAANLARGKKLLDTNASFIKFNEDTNRFLIDKSKIRESEKVEVNDSQKPSTADILRSKKVEILRKPKNKVQAENTVISSSPAVPLSYTFEEIKSLVASHSTYEVAGEVKDSSKAVQKQPEVVKHEVQIEATEPVIEPSPEAVPEVTPEVATQAYPQYSQYGPIDPNIPYYYGTANYPIPVDGQMMHPAYMQQMQQFPPNSPHPNQAHHIPGQFPPQHYYPPPPGAYPPQFNPQPYYYSQGHQQAPYPQGQPAPNTFSQYQ